MGHEATAAAVGPGVEQQADIQRCAHDGVVEVQVSEGVTCLAWWW